MFAGCMRWALSHAVRTACGGSPAYGTPASRFTICSDRHNVIAASRTWSPFCTTEEGTGQATATKKRKQDTRAHASIGSVDKKIPHREIQVINEAGVNLGTMQRTDVLRIMDEGGLKLVLLNKNQNPPVYKLMSEEQMAVRDKNKEKTARVQVKALALSSSIASHDLSLKMKQAAGWLEKKHHVRITVRETRRGPTVNLETLLEQMVAQIEVKEYVSKPKVGRDGKAAMCTLRMCSAKELKERKRLAESQSANSTAKVTESKTSLVSGTDTTEGSIQR